jgi:integrase
MTAPRRPKGEGRVRLRADGRYETTVTVTDEFGHRKPKSIYGKTEREAIARRNAFRRGVDRGEPVDPSKQTLSHYIEGWLKGDARRHVKEHVLPSYAFSLEHYILPYLGQRPISEITAPQVQATLNKLDAEGFAPATVARAKGCLQSAMRDAANSGLIGQNPVEGTRAPSQSKSKMDFWQPDETRTFLASIKGHPQEAYYILSLTLGLRISEALGLRWCDVDIERRTLRVQQTLHSGPVRRPVIAGVKRSASDRVVRLTRQLADALRVHAARQKEARLHLGERWQNIERDLVFVSSLGTPLSQNNMRRQFHGLAKNAGLRQIRIHDMRHTAASLMIATGVNMKVVSETLGHSSIRITLDLYAHLLDEQKEHLADQLDRLLGGGSV